MIDEREAEAQLHFLADTDEESARLHGEAMKAEHMADVAEAMAYQMCDGSIEDRKRAARLADDVRELREKHIDAVVAWEALRAKRKSAEIAIETWRTVESSRRAMIR